MDAIDVSALRKHYGAKQVLDDVSLRVPNGVCWGLLGPNGAGKTTLIRILLGLLRASSGEARLFGKQCWREGAAVRADVGYLPGDVRFPERQTAQRFIDDVAAIRGMRDFTELRRLAAAFDLDLSIRIRKYSHGMKQKLGLLAALFHKPKLVVLDEPTTALDPLVRQVLFDELRRIGGEGRTIVFSSHTLREVELLCDDVVILRSGRVVANETVDSLRAKAARHVDVLFRSGAAPPPTPAGLTVSRRDERRINGTYSGPMAALTAWLASAGVEDVTIGAPDLEDLFLAFYDQRNPEARMMRAILRRSMRDCASLFLLALMVITGFEMFLVRALGEFSHEFRHLLMQKNMIRNMVRMLLGADLASDLTPTTLMTIGLAHPVLFTVAWAYLITCATRVPAGEIDRGTADVFLTLPVRRSTYYVGNSLVWLAAGAPLTAAAVCGIRLGELWHPMWEPMDFARLARPAVNFFTLYLAVGGITAFFSAIVVRRGIAVGCAMGVVIFSLLSMFLSQFWPEIDRVTPFSLLHYYRPLPWIRSGTWPVRDMLVLCGVGFGFWLAGMIAFCRRDIPAT